MLNNIQAIYFDLDNTLIDRDAIFQKSIQEILPLAAEKTLQTIYQIDNHGFTPRKEFCDWFLKTYTDNNLPSALFFDELVENMIANLQPNKEIILMLTQLKAHYRIGILTNGSKKNQLAKINKAQLNTIFNSDNIYVSQPYKIAKPNPKLFQIVLDSLDISPKNLLYIGDNPKNDVFGAKQLGIKTCWVNHGRTWKENYEYDFTICKITDLKKIITD